MPLNKRLNFCPPRPLHRAQRRILQSFNQERLSLQVPTGVGRKLLLINILSPGPTTFTVSADMNPHHKRQNAAPKGGHCFTALIYPSTLNKFRPVSWKFCAAIIC